MLVNVVSQFVIGDRRYEVGENLDVPWETAQAWVRDGKAVADRDNDQDPGYAVRALTDAEWVAPSSYPELMLPASQRVLHVYRGKFWHNNATDAQPGTGWVYAGGGTWQDVSGPITVAAYDAGSMWRLSSAGTITIPAGLTLPPSFVVLPPSSGNLSVAVSGGATINGAATTLTRTRALNPAGVAIVAYGGDAYGLSGCAA
jgi:hypothetical protein